MAKSGIQDLIDSSPYRKGGVPLLRQMPRETAAAIVADLGAINKAQSQHRSIPSHSAIAAYIAERHAVAIPTSTIGSWLRKLRNGESIL